MLPLGDDRDLPGGLVCSLHPRNVRGLHGTLRAVSADLLSALLHHQVIPHPTILCCPRIEHSAGEYCRADPLLALGVWCCSYDMPFDRQFCLGCNDEERRERGGNSGGVLVEGDVNKSAFANAIQQQGVVLIDTAAMSMDL